MLQAQYRSRDTTVLLASHLCELCLIDGGRMRFGCGRLVPRARPNHDFRHISALCACMLEMEQASAQGALGLIVHSARSKRRGAVKPFK